MNTTPTVNPAPRDGRTAAEQAESVIVNQEPTRQLPSTDYVQRSYVEQRAPPNLDYVARSQLEQPNPNYTDTERFIQQRAPTQADYVASNPNYTPLNAEFSRPRASLERTDYTAKERTTNNSTNINSNHTDYVLKERPNPNFVLPSQMRPAPGPPQPRPPFAGARPMVGVGPRPPLPPNMTGRPMPPPLRPTDSKSNLHMGPPPNMRPGMPPARLPNPGGQLSPPGQAAPRPPGGFPWSGPGMPRPPQNMTRPPPPTFARPMPGQPLQAPFRAPIYNQPQPQMQQQLQQQQQPQQMPHQQQQQQPRPPSASSAHNEDDDDVIIGQAQTPLKSYSMKPDPMGSPLLEETEPTFEGTSSTDAPPLKQGGHSKSYCQSGRVH